MKLLGLGVSGAPFLMPPRGGLTFAIQFRCYPMRLLITLLVLILSSCSTENKPFQAPPGTEGGWKLTTSTPTEAPEWMTRLGIKQAVKARYAGPIDAEADIFELRSDAAALECIQLWKNVKAEDRFYKRNLFVVVRSPHPNREMLMDFSRAIQKAL